MKNFNLKLNEDQANALGYILRNAHHIPLPNVCGEDTILPLSREVLDALNDAPESGVIIGEFSEAAEDMHAGAAENSREFHGAMSRFSRHAQDICS